MSRSVFTSILASLLFLAPIAVRGQNDLSDKVKRAVDQAGEAYRAGRFHEVIRLVGPLLASLAPDDLRLADEQLKANHDIDVPLAGLAVQARVELVLDGKGARLPRPAPIEVPLALIALDERMAFLLEPIRRELDVGFPALIPDDVLNEKAPTLATMASQIDQAGLLVAHINQLAARLSGAERAALDGRAQDIATRKLAEEQKKLDGLRDRLTARLIEFNLVRLNNASTTLGNQSVSFIKRFQAALRAEDCLASIHAHWDHYKAWKKRNGGLDPNIELRWRRLEQQVQMRYADLHEKVVHFSEGTRLWLLGRYGRGPLADGLARLARTAGVSDKLAQASLNAPLLMPAVIRKPDDPSSVPLPFPIARRHQEWWRYPVEPSQLVGFAEYSMALNHLEHLLRITSTAEQRVIDEMIADDDRFVVHSGLSSRFDALDPASTLRLANPPRDPRAARANERRGLAWIMAHARVELDAMGTLQEPSIIVSGSTLPTQLEENAYLELLLDSTRQQYYECFTEEALIIRRPDRTAFSRHASVLLQQLERKLAMTSGLAQTFRIQATGRLSPMQQTELDGWIARVSIQRELVRDLVLGRFDDKNMGIPREQQRAPRLPAALLDRATRTDRLLDNAKPK